MPTPYGSRGAMAFGTEELRVLRRALALALKPSSATAEDVQDCLRLARSVDEAARESARLRAFLLADLARYRAALPGTATGYLALLGDALGAGHRPTADDLAALRALRGNPTAAALLDRCLDRRAVPAQQDAEPRVRTEPETATTAAAPTVPASRTRLTALPGGLSDLSDGTRTRAVAQEPAGRPADKPARPARPAQPTPRPARPAQPAEKPAPSPQPKAPSPSPSRRPIPTPGEVFPPKRKPSPPAKPEQRQLAAG
ncbi:hypothetical protein [Streptomyces bluensis]|uniref:Uncharacterized protein n=1 Tax=Streptomyces bluensis TaxID=33897 RepID=A0ABW6US03_9ACTN